ncbi:MAG: glycosyltransferase [Vicinamibacterales bacterium]|nr:glycosyltransferase [Vicinamibacterales bacterium]
MKVLLTGFEWFGDLLPFVERALKELGAEVSVVATNRDQLIRERAEALRNLEALPLIGASLAARQRLTLTLDGIRQVNDAFRREVDRFAPDVVLSILCWGEPLSAESLGYAARARRIGWLMDDPFGYQESLLENLLTSFDSLYSPDERWSDNIERMTGVRPAWLPCGADPGSHHPIDVTALDQDLAGHIVYVGSSCAGHPTGVYRQTLLESLDGLPLAIYGDKGWCGLGGFAAKAYRGGPVDSERANVIYASGAIALNLHHTQFHRGTSLRTFALCCAGTFQLVDWRDGLDRWFRPGVELETFRTPTELRRQAERYLADTGGRARIAAAGRRRVLSEHTYRHRLSLMLKTGHHAG